ncbi:polysaccharide deacetylase family protein [Alkalihalobacillus sp. R86527]|uniref:polysaccharide deacetylase family protein n=1 Tax=Alkalihalobacillus sp. R86527 TaxID=3093863 RepID=UPI00366B9F00
MLRRLPFSRIKWPGWLVLILIGVLIIIGTGNWLVNTIEKKKEQANELEVSSITFEEATENTDLYTMIINTPVIEDSTVNEAISVWITEQKESFLSEVESQKGNLGDGYRAHLTIQADVKQGTNDTYHLIFNSYRLVKTVTGETHIKTFAIDSNNRIIKLTDFLNTSEKPLNKVRSSVREQFQKNEALKVDLLDQKVNEALKDPNSWDWLINKDRLTLYFEKSSLTKNNSGTLKVDVPLNVISADIQKYNDGIVGEKYVALTFDDGPSREVTPRVLKTLNDHEAKATFFMLGKQVESYPSLAEEVAEAGHEIGNHTDDHINLTKIGKPQLVNEVQKASKKIQDATGQTPIIIRPPYGAINKEVEEVAKDNGSSLVLWSVDSLDWKSKNVEAINKVVQREVVPGSIILLHDVHPTTADALPTILTALEEEGYHFLTVSQLLSIQEKFSVGPYYGTT